MKGICCWDSTGHHCQSVLALANTVDYIRKKLTADFAPTRRSLWQPSADGFVCFVFDSSLMWQQSLEGLVYSVVFIQTGIAIITEDSVHLLGALVIDCWPPFQLHFLSLQTQLALTAIHSLSLTACQLHHLVSSRITNYRGFYSSISSLWAGKLVFRCFMTKVWQDVYPNPSEHTAGNLSPLCTMTFRIFLFLFSASQKMCGLWHWKTM